MSRTHKQPFRKTRVVGRWVSGRPLDGKPRTDSTFLQPATKVLTVTGRASRWASLPGWKRSAIRQVTLFGPIAAVAGYVADPAVTTATVGTVSAAVTAHTGYRATRAVRNYRYRKTVVRPLSRALSRFVDMQPSDVEKSLVLPAYNADLTESQIKVPLPEHFAGRVEQVKDITRIIGQRIGGDWDVESQLRIAPFYLHFTPRPTPPDKVTYEMVRPAILATTQDKPVLGLGARAETINLDFTGEIAHLAASIGTGGGKSSFLRFLVAQFAYHGVRDFTVCDVKWVSLAGMEGVPGLSIYRDVEEIWDAIASDRAEMDRRYRELLADPTRKFPRKVIILEEQNAFALETAIRWRQIKQKGDPNTCPVWDDIGMLLLKARQVNINLISVYQRMSADACGGGTYRDQYGLKLLSRFSPQAWDTLVGTRPRGISSAIQGRAISVMGGIHRTVQIPFISVDDAMELATSGVAPAPYTPLFVQSQSGTASYRERSAAPNGAVTIREAIELGIISGDYDAWRMRVNRDDSAPKPLGKRGKSHVYDATALRDWATSKRTVSR